MEFQKESNRIFLEKDGVLLAEITFPLQEGVCCINRTFVDPSLRGQGVAGQLMEQATAQIRSSGKKARAVCSYAVSWFEKHPDAQDLLE